MTAVEIATRLRRKPITAERVGKLARLCQRSAVAMPQVLAVLTDAEQTAIRGCLTDAEKAQYGIA